MSLESEHKQSREKIKFITVDVFICLSIFDYRALFVCVKDKTYLRIAMPINCFDICRSIFDVLLCLLDRKLVLGSNDKYEEVSMCSLKCEDISSYGQRRNVIFS